MARHSFSRKLVLFTLALGLAPAVQAEDLMDIYRLAQQNDPVFRSAQATYRANQQVVPQAQAALLPTITAVANYNKSSDQLSAPTDLIPVRGQADYHSDVFFLRLRQTIFNYADFLRYGQAEKALLHAGIELSAAEQELISRTAQIYLNVLLAQQTLDLAVAEKTAISRQLELAQARLDVGLGTVTEVYEAQSRYSLAEAQEIDARNALADAHQALAELVGEAPEKLAKFTRGIPLSRPEPDDIEQWVAKALDQNLGLLSRRYSADIAHDELRIQRGGHLPTLDFLATNQRTDQEASLSSANPSVRDSTDLTLQLEIPLLQGGLVVAKTDEARARWDATIEDLEKQRRSTIRDTRDAYLGVTGQAAQVKALREAVTAAESALEGKQKGFEAGLNSNIDVLDAQRDLYRAKRDYARGQFNYLLNLLRLDQTAGQLDEGALRRINAWLE